MENGRKTPKMEKMKANISVKWITVMHKMHYHISIVQYAHKTEQHTLGF